jgi:hypothetical protein
LHAVADEENEDEVDGRKLRDMLLADQSQTEEDYDIDDRGAQHDIEKSVGHGGQIRCLGLVLNSYF